jgi:hypothetical protein
MVGSRPASWVDNLIEIRLPPISMPQTALSESRFIEDGFTYKGFRDTFGACKMTTNPVKVNRALGGPEGETGIDEMTR